MCMYINYNGRQCNFKYAGSICAAGLAGLHSLLTISDSKTSKIYYSFHKLKLLHKETMEFFRTVIESVISKRG